MALRERFINKGGVFCAEERNRQTYKWTPNCITKGAQRGQGLIVLREGVINKGGGYRAEKTNRQAYKWIDIGLPSSIDFLKIIISNLFSA